MVDKPQRISHIDLPQRSRLLCCLLLQIVFVHQRAKRIREPFGHQFRVRNAHHLNTHHAKSRYRAVRTRSSRTQGGEAEALQ